MNSFGAWTKSAQAIAAEVADYSKKSVEGSAAAGKSSSARKAVEKAMEVQSEYLKSSYEDFVAEATKLGELYRRFRQGSLQAVRRRDGQSVGDEVTPARGCASGLCRSVFG